MLNNYLSTTTKPHSIIMTTYHPFSNGLFGELNRLVNSTFGPAYSGSRQGSGLALQDRGSLESLSDDDQGLKLRLELPGYTKDEVKLSVEEGVLRIVANTEDEERSFLSRQERRLRISDEVDIDNIQARLENGILYVQIPHRAKAEPKTIAVH